LPENSQNNSQELEPDTVRKAILLCAALVGFLVLAQGVGRGTLARSSNPFIHAALVVAVVVVIIAEAAAWVCLFRLFLPGSGPKGGRVIAALIFASIFWFAALILAQLADVFATWSLL